MDVERSFVLACARGVSSEFFVRKQLVCLLFLIIEYDALVRNGVAHVIFSS